PNSDGRPTNRGAAEEPLRSPAQISGRKEVQMVPDGHVAPLQGLSMIPYLTSVAAAPGLPRLSEFAVAPARLIDNDDRRAIGIALCTAAALHRGCIGDE
ncbi:hypothetical protein THAOC_23828, partial [Thalassiosira oceanica]